MDSPLILIVIPQNRFCSKQLFDLKEVLLKNKVQCLIFSKSGKEAKGEDKSFIQPDGMLVDWNRFLQGKQKYDAVIVIGGKGSKNSIWEDPILPQILTDHFRAGKILGAFGLSVVALARAGLISQCEISAVDDQACLQELAEAGAFPEKKKLITTERIVTSNDPEGGKKFGEALLRILGQK
tara:strand:+ start:405 stop:947 length:543 start_codon:yes stop_codon:yes gene_type:complete